MNQIANKKKIELEEKLRKVAEREKQLKNQLKAIDAREREAARKRETRAKIILGGFVVSQLKKDEEGYSALFDKAIEAASERDRELLAGYKKNVFQF
ncbi:hypothetical protein NBRC116583_02430 [Arenicella sp. 4NH20-0111]|uniref:hypothetical protein n=1 Tax=Arenicella sp. 4NH20-0111 TaxID=3127648 RepID=UPI0031092166